MKDKKINKKPGKDQHAKREESKYDKPVASREHLTEVLEFVGKPLTHPQMCEELGITDADAIEGVRRRLIAMCRDGQLMSNRNDAYGLINKLDLVKGRIQGHPNGFGFLICEDDHEDVFISERQMRCVFDGDDVLLRKMGLNFKGKPEGKIIEIIKRNTQSLVGRFSDKSGSFFVTPENKRISIDVSIDAAHTMGAKEGDVVKIEITDQPQYRRPPVGQVVEVLGETFAPGLEMDIALQNHNIPHEFPEAVLKQADLLADTLNDEDLVGRVDLRGKPFITIDGEDARDFDDAVFAQAKKGGGFHLYVAIADVSHYVPVGTALDEHAHVRSTSVYFPERVIPMLPEKLSNGLCSLNPQVDRLTMVCQMETDADGQLLDYHFYQAVIHSHERLTYTQVGGYLENQTKITEQKSVTKSIKALYSLYNLLTVQRKARGAIEFESVESRIIFNEDRKIDKIVPVIRNDAHKLIEECMLMANECAAKFLIDLEIPGLFRVHKGPNETKLEKLRGFLGEQGIDLKGGNKPTSKDFLAVIEQIRDREDFEVLQTVLLRSMSQAVYDPENDGHFGLGYEAYTHFTSPIRRYPDLLMHRALKSVIGSKKRTNRVRRVQKTPKIDINDIYPYDFEKLVHLGEHCSMCERRADEASWDVLAWLKCEYMQDKVGLTYTGIVSTVTSFGIFVQLDEIHVDGLVHVSSLASDYYHFDEAKHRLIGEHTKAVFSMGSEIEIRVKGVDLDTRKIDFELAQEQPARPKKPKKKKKPKHK
ncbi:ribonuclease R [Marinicellulosiphila megalodicopiae]|uniref:ribonuclease R n=1 Tax=Marinicellulosiphila megalodicopiae TaxID=2724896 RepID=UPI003BAEF2E1